MAFHISCWLLSPLPPPSPLRLTFSAVPFASMSSHPLSYCNLLFFHCPTIPFYSITAVSYHLFYHCHIIPFYSITVVSYPSILSLSYHTLLLCHCCIIPFYSLCLTIKVPSHLTSTHISSSITCM